jgi:hypothetical protein
LSWDPNTLAVRLTEPLIMDDSALQGIIGPIAKTPYPEGIRQTLAAARAHQ